MATDFNSSSNFMFFNNTFKNINQKKSEYNDQFSNNFYVNDENEFVEVGDFAIPDSQENNNAETIKDDNVFSFFDEINESSSFAFDDEDGSFFEDLG